jgi:hypothetical protein
MVTADYYLRRTASEGSCRLASKFVCAGRTKAGTLGGYAVAAAASSLRFAVTSRKLLLSP